MGTKRRFEAAFKGLGRSGVPISLFLATGCQRTEERTNNLFTDNSKSLNSASDERFPIASETGGQTSSTTSSLYALGSAIKGPLENAVTFFDFNNDGLLNEFRTLNFDQDGNQTGFTTQMEPQARTNGFGSFEIYTNIASNADIQLAHGETQKASEARLATLSDGDTIDRSSNQALPGVLLTAPAGSTVITPLTTLMDFAGLSSDQLKSVLNLGAQVPDLNSFNHYADESLAAAGVQIENFSQQMIATITAYSGLLELSGLDANTAYQTTLSALADIAVDKLASGAILKLYETPDLDTLKQSLDEQLDILNAGNKSVFLEHSQGLNEGLTTLNANIATVTDLFTNEATAQYSNVANLNERVKATILQDGTTFDFASNDQSFSGERLGIGAKIPVSSISGEEGKKLTSPFAIYLEDNAKTFVWSYFDQRSIDELELVTANSESLTEVTTIFSKPGLAQFDSESIPVSNNMVVHVTSHRSDQEDSSTQISLVLTEKNAVDGALQKLDEFTIHTDVNEENLDATLLEVGENHVALAWTSYIPNQSKHDIFAQLFQIDLSTKQIVPEKVEFRVNKFSDGNQTNVSLGQLDGDTFSATWVSERIAENSGVYTTSSGTEIYRTVFTEYGIDKQISETLTLTIFEDQYNNLQITSNFQVGTVSGKFMAYAAGGITDATEVTIKEFQIELLLDEAGQVLPINFDASSLITEADIQDNHGGNTNLNYKLISLQQDWRGLHEAWLMIDNASGMITGQPILTKIGYNEVAGFLSYPTVNNGSILEFDAQSTDSVLPTLSRDTIFNNSKFINGLNTEFKTLDTYSIDIIREAVTSSDLRVQLKKNFTAVLDSFDENGTLVPITIDPITGLRVERYIDDFGVLSLKSFEGAVLIGTELINLPELLEEGANALQGLYGTMFIDPISGMYEYDLDTSAARQGLNESPTGTITETFEVKYAKDTLVSAGVGGTNFQPKTISLANGTVYNLWLNKFPIQDIMQVSEYKSYLQYAAGTQVKFAPNLYDQSLKVNASISEVVQDDLQLAIVGSGDDLILKIEVNGEVYQSHMVPVDGTRVKQLDPTGAWADAAIIETINNESETTEFYPGNYEYRATGQIDLGRLGGNLGWLTNDNNTSFFSEYGEFLFDPITGKYEFKLTWGANYEFQSAIDVYDYFSSDEQRVLQEDFDLHVGRVKIDVLSEEDTIFFTSENASFDGLLLSQETLQNVGENQLRLEYDVLSAYSTENFDPDAPLDFNVQSQRFLDTVSNVPASALTEYESFGDYGSLVVDQNTGEYVYNLNRNIVRRETDTGEVTWEYELDMASLFAGNDLLDTFHLTISNYNKAVYTSLKEVPIGQLPTVGTGDWIENIDETQLMISAHDANGQVIVEPIVIDDDFGYYTQNFDAELVSDSHILLAWTKVNSNQEASISAAYFDTNADTVDLFSEFNANEFLVSDIAESGQSNPQVSASSDGDFSIVWEAYPFLTAQDMENMELVYDLYNVDTLDVRATSYYQPEPDDNIIEDFDEFMRYLEDTKIFDVPLDQKIEQLDQNKVQDYLEVLGDYLYHVEYGTDFYGLPEIS